MVKSALSSRICNREKYKEKKTAKLQRLSSVITCYLSSLAGNQQGLSVHFEREGQFAKTSHSRHKGEKRDTLVQNLGAAFENGREKKWQ